MIPFKSSNRDVGILASDDSMPSLNCCNSVRKAQGILSLYETIHKVVPMSIASSIVRFLMSAFGASY